jgi:CubicO group peptidase (beta-lactamase class C family)
MSFGYILGEIVRRTDPKHRLPGAFIREEILEPLEINEVWFGLPPSEEPRVARLTWGTTPPVPLVVSTPGILTIRIG